MEDSTAGPSRNNTENSFTSSTRVVRVHWLKFLFYSWKRISILSKFVISCYILLVILQVATAIVILITSTSESCDQPLRTFIIVYLVRVIISCPFSIGGHFQREQRRMMIVRQRERDRVREEQVRSRRARRRQSGVTTNLESSNSPSIHSTIVEPQSSWITSSGEKLRSIVDLFAILWFIVGNYLLFSSNNCSSEAPQLYYTTLAFILMGYFILILPLILCTSAILCLPCVLSVMRALNMTELSGMNQGAKSDEISKIPVYRYRVASTSTSTAEQQQEPAASSKKSNGFFAKLLKGYRHHEVNDSESGSYEDMHISPIEDAMCCICLSEYEDNDLICKLWCGHHYHRSCVTDWFRLNRKCPLCKQDFRGKDHDEYSEDDNEEPSSRHGNEFQMDQISASR